MNVNFCICLIKQMQLRLLLQSWASLDIASRCTLEYAIF